jgi:hypothetical protein
MLDFSSMRKAISQRVSVGGQPNQSDLEVKERRSSLAAFSVDADSIFEQARELGFPVQDEKLKAFIESLRE